MKKLKWKVEKKRVSDLREWPKNPRKITEEEYRSLKKSIIKRGFHDVVKIDADGTVISGNQRLRVLTELDVEYVYALYPNRFLTQKERDTIALESNLHKGEFDFDILANSFEQNDLVEAGLELGFDMEEKICPRCGK